VKCAHGASIDEAAASSYRGRQSGTEVERFAARHQLALQCDAVPAGSDLIECLADDPQARGGTATHPMTLQLFFMFYGDRLHTFTSTPRPLE